RHQVRGVGAVTTAVAEDLAVDSSGGQLDEHLVVRADAVLARGVARDDIAGKGAAEVLSRHLVAGVRRARDLLVGAAPLAIPAEAVMEGFDAVGRIIVAP